MLISEPKIFNADPIYKMIGNVKGNNFDTEELIKGIYKIPHFGGSFFISGYKDFFYAQEEILNIEEYGVCDNYQQILDQCPEIEKSDRKFIITLTPVLKKNQSPDGGWRWHKWGPYIGEQKPQCEYLFDEPEIDEIFVYHIYEKE